MSSPVSTDSLLSWRLSGKPLLYAVVVAALLFAVVFAAAAYDLASPVERRPVPLEIAALIGKLVVAGGLTIVARRTGSVSMRLLAALAGLLAVAGLLADTALVDSIIDAVGNPLADTTGLSGGVVHNGLLFGVLGVAALALVTASWFKARPGERQVVRVLISLFAAVGVFAGPVNAIAAAGINREWLFAEDLGQAVVLAVMAGYVAGLAADSQNRR